MTTTDLCSREIHERIAATRTALEGLCRRLHPELVTRLPKSEVFPAELLLRELLNNAVEHGCSRDPALEVRCTLRFTPGALSIIVEDDGEGFDWRAAQKQELDELGFSGRGMIILRHYAAEVRYSDKGNHVEVIRTLDRQGSR